MTEEIKILNVSKQGKKYKIATSEEECLLTEDTLVRFLITKDRTFTKAEFSEILAFDEENKLFEKALRFLARQSRSVNEVREYLAEISEAEIGEKVIKRLLDLNYLDDRLFVQNLLDYALRNFRGPRYLEDRMKKSGIDSELMAEALSRYDEETEKKLIYEYLEKYKEREKERPERKQKLLLLQKLQRAGFSYDAIHSCLRDVEFVDESEEYLDEKILRLETKYREIEGKKKKEKIIRRLLSEGYDYGDIAAHLKSEE